ncbi:hypothetical protein J4050_06160 [Winogradskyella sp. DF17]|uniref:DUF4179 domain-containing protein n=1 Tax=Winogradskyella pelagia TaxID=2819984 RepID=A0ABS3T349_9FLAO|nr:hypothetical protein [Winogradskyella sp. DF17]MBO3116321.1 hypothetical protein [Winogradskyella sp. DF17]
MKKNETIEKLFENLKGEFDIASPQEGHKARFIQRLDEIEHKGGHANQQSTPWQKFLAIAASLILCSSIFMIIPKEPEVLDLANVSPQLSETQDFFTATIENELRKLNKEKSPFTEAIILDAMEEIKSLEQDYENLKISLSESGEDQRVIYAMISNFQSRIDILNTVLEEIETIKQLKTNTNVTKNTL